VKTVLKWKNGDRGVVTNGRVIGPLPDNEAFTPDDFALLDVITFNSFGEKILGVFKKLKDKGIRFF